jgi:hypothetical protein
METITSVQYYGVCKLGENRYQVISGANPTTITKSGYFYSTLSEVYKNADFTMKKAESFAKSMYKPFVNFQNKKVIFKFVNIGVIQA